MVMCNVAYVLLYTYDVVFLLYIICCVYIAYAVLGIDGAMHTHDMQCCVHIIPCTCWICGVMCIWCCAHVEYAVLCMYGAMYMSYM